MNDFSTVIIGGGISGLTCAKYLNEKGYSFMLLEGSDALGGRVRTDKVDGFLLDRGFQILLTNYPEAKKILNYNNLDLKYFGSGAMIKAEKGFMKMENPFRNKMAYLTMAFSSVGSLSDKLKIRKFANELSEISDVSSIAKPAFVPSVSIEVNRISPAPRSSTSFAHAIVFSSVALRPPCVCTMC